MRTAATIALGAALLLPHSAGAIIPVIDELGVAKLFEEVQLMQQQLQSAMATLHAVTNVPGNLVQQAEGLLSMGVQNPLGDIRGTLSSIMNGGPLTGTCASAAGEYVSANRYGLATGSDFSGAMINSSSAQLGGVMSCLQTMTRSTQDRLNQMPQLLSDLQACEDVSCTTAVSGRIQLETATIQAQTNQAILVGQAAQMQRWTQEDQVIEKMRRDSEATVNGTSGTNGAGASTMTTQQAPAFVAPPGG